MRVHIKDTKWTGAHQACEVGACSGSAEIYACTSSQHSVCGQIKRRKCVSTTAHEERVCAHQARTVWACTASTSGLNIGTKHTNDAHEVHLHRQGAKFAHARHAHAMREPTSSTRSACACASMQAYQVSRHIKAQKVHACTQRTSSMFAAYQTHNRVCTTNQMRCTQQAHQVHTMRAHQV